MPMYIYIYIHIKTCAYMYMYTYIYIGIVTAVTESEIMNTWLMHVCQRGPCTFQHGP